MNLKNELIKTVTQFIKFGIVGLSNTGISYIANIVVIYVFQRIGVSWDYIAGNIAGFIIGTIWSFIWNSRFVFKVEDGQTRNPLKALAKTFATYAFSGIVLNNVLSFIWINWIGINKYIAPLLNLIITVPVNFLISKLWAFRTVNK